MTKSLRTYLPNLLLVCLAACPVFLIALEMDLIGYLLLGVTTYIVLNTGIKTHRTQLLIICVCLFILSFVEIHTATTNQNFFQMGLPLLAISFGVIRISKRLLTKQIPFRLFSEKRVHRYVRLYPLLAFLLAGLILPWYFSINPEVPMHWHLSGNPTQEELTRLFWGSNFLGMRDEVFFVNVVFYLLRQQFSFWKANIIQAVYFTSFLYELAFTGIGPLLIFPFALLQGYIYEKRESVGYIIVIHLLVDTALYLSIVSAHVPGRYPRFPWWY